MGSGKRPWFDISLGLAASVLLLGMVLLTFADVVGRYVFNSPLRGAFEITELALLTLIFAGLPLVSHADEHVTMDFIDRWVGPRTRRLIRRLVHLLCAVAIGGMAWLMFLKAGRIAGYGDTTDVLKIPVAPFVYFMSVMVLATGVIHLIAAFSALPDEPEPAFDPNKTSTT
ncbi:MAG TPA: TRAP transporter small permease [Burkholderiaceae bacterium]|nr:TRAP transporter small permease [Burkholderiaceae bacterium]